MRTTKNGRRENSLNDDMRLCRHLWAQYGKAHLPIVHHEGYVSPMPEGHRFPMKKFDLVYQILKKDDVIRSSNQVFRPERPSWNNLLLVHDQYYIKRLRTLSLPEKDVRRIGLPLNREVVNRCCYETGGTIMAAKLALEYGLAASTAGGTHHAFPSFGSGFCVINDLAVAASVLQSEGAVNKILVVDLDVHQGDGTAFVFRENDSIFTFSMHCEQNFPMKKQTSDLDVALEQGMSGEDYMSSLSHHLPWLLDLLRPELVLYDAGVDVHRDDLLGRLMLSDADIHKRDLYVIDACVGRGIPCACVIGGGYSKDIMELSKRHTLVHRAASRIWTNRGL